MKSLLRGVLLVSSLMGATACSSDNNADASVADAPVGPDAKPADAPTNTPDAKPVDASTAGG